MLIASFPAGPWQANCYVVARGRGEDCVIIDPGVEAAAIVREVVAEQALRPAAILLSHGHIDHIASAAELGRHFEIPTWLQPADRALLTDPAKGLGPDSRALLDQLLGTSQLTEPPIVAELFDGQELGVAGLEFRVSHAPGHTAGCVLLSTDYPDSTEVSGLVFSGDVLFAGSIGRTDLPGGDPDVMLASLRDKVSRLPDGLAVLPGHGPQTTMRREKMTNPYLQPSFLDS